MLAKRAQDPDAKLYATLHTLLDSYTFPAVIDALWDVDKERREHPEMVERRKSMREMPKLRKVK